MCVLESALSIMLTVVLKPPMNGLAIYPSDVPRSILKSGAQWAGVGGVTDTTY